MSEYVFSVGDYLFSIDVTDVLFAAFFSFFLTWIITSFLKFRRFLKSVPTIKAGIMELREVMERCKNLFPIDNMEFRGNTFTRGMAVRITLFNKKSYKGSFVGLNSQNIVCIITPKSIITQDIKYIENLEPLEPMERQTD